MISWFSSKTTSSTIVTIVYYLSTQTIAWCQLINHHLTPLVSREEIAAMKLIYQMIDTTNTNAITKQQLRFVFIWTYSDDASSIDVVYSYIIATCWGLCQSKVDCRIWYSPPLRRRKETASASRNMWTALASCAKVLFKESFKVYC